MSLACWASRAAVFVVLLATALTGCGASDEGAGERVAPSSSSAAALPTSGAGSVSTIEPCPPSGEPVGRGDGVPEIVLPCLGAGEPVQMAGLTGRPRLINIWASWCEPCRDEMPWLQQAHDTGEVDVLRCRRRRSGIGGGSAAQRARRHIPFGVRPTQRVRP